MMTVCRLCGNEIREGDDVVVNNGETAHADCAEAPKRPRRRRIGRWGVLGSRNQMGMGDVQRDPS